MASDSTKPKKAAAPKAKTAKSAPAKDVVAVVEVKKTRTAAPRKTTATHKSHAHASSDAPAPEAVPAPAPAVATPAPASSVPTEPFVATKPTEAAVPAQATTSEDESSDKNISMKPPIIVKELATKLGCKPFQLIHDLMSINVFATLNQAIEEDLARKICEKRGFTFNVEKREKGAGVHKPEPVVAPPPPPPVEVEKLKLRPPVVTLMGHVDHGKTSLLDSIRQTRVAAGEAGGITQHIGAYTVSRNNQSITFLDTPGHEAFTSMRARGAHVTDIVVIVIAADDGIMPTTLEAIKHAQAAKVKIMVAINKIDMPGANVDKVKGQLQEHGLTPEDWGGDIICCEVSATKKIGIEKLIEMILLESEMLELKADGSGDAKGIVIESQIEQGRGATATVLVQKGTLKYGDAFICGMHWGKIKALINDLGQNIKQAGPSTPVKIIGLSSAPSPGDEFLVVTNDKEARSISEERLESERLGKLTQNTNTITLENLFASIKEGQKKTLNVVLKTDVQGSLEAIVDSLKNIKSQKVDINFILSSIGPISVSDVLLAKASEAVIIGFNTRTDNTAATAAKKENVQIKLYSIIYELIDQVKEAMAGLLDPEVRESQIGTAVVKKVFELSKFPVAGCMVQTGRILKSGRARLLRRKQPIYDGAIVTLKRFQDEANEVRAGLECGVRLGNFNEYMADDVIECYILEKVAQSL